MATDGLDRPMRFAEVTSFPKSAYRMRYQAITAVPALQQVVPERIFVALQPLAEQHGIVAKVDALMALCDRLEVSLIGTDNTRRQLLDAVLTEALAPADDRELETAE